MARKAATAEPTTVNLERAKVLAAARAKAAFDPGLFSLTVPTGGGKTGLAHVRARPCGEAPLRVLAPRRRFGPDVIVALGMVLLRSNVAKRAEIGFTP